LISTDQDLPPYWQGKGPSAPGPLDAAFSAEWLSGQTFPALEYVVPGILPEGLSILVAPPKAGKSWLVLSIGLAAADGSTVLGSIPVTKRPVLYCALEDGPRRLQQRMKTLGIDHGPADLVFLTSLEGAADETIRAYLDRHRDEKPLVVLDTLGKIRGTYAGNDRYGHDYSQMSALKDLVDAVPGSSLLVVHHTRKSQSEDFLDSVSGTQGIAGAADSVLAIKRPRGTDEGTLFVTSRDAAEGEYAITLSEGMWSLDGADLREASAAVQQRQENRELGDLSQQVLAAIRDAPTPVTPKTIAAVVSGLNGDNDSASTYLTRLAGQGRIRKVGRGKYASAPPSDPPFEPFEVFEPLVGEEQPPAVKPLSNTPDPEVFERKQALTRYSDTSNASNTPTQDDAELTSREAEREAPSLRAQVIAAVEQAQGEVTPPELLEVVPALSTFKVAGTILGQLARAGHIAKVGRGKYAALDHQENVA
jgi:hypothetical protein